jgi:hypothetical protein
VVRPDAPGHIGLAGHHLGPEPLQGLEQAGVAGLDVNVGNSGEQVELTDRVSLDRRGIAYGFVVLPVLPAKPAVAEQSVPTPVDEIAGSFQV